MLTRRAFFGSAAVALQAARQPNVVILYADDLGSGELGFQGNPEIATPHIDSIARGGVRFEQGYSSAPFCCPARAGLMTGRYQTRFGHELNVVGKANLDPRIGLPLTQRTMADHLKSAGYATGLIGKWHLGSQPQFHPQRRGFDEFFGFLHEGHFYFPPPYRGGVTRLRTNEPPYDDENPILRGQNPVVEQEYLTDALAREAVGFVERNQQRPFYLNLAFNAIHSPMQAPVGLMKEFESIRDEHRRLFAAMLRSMDNAVGRVLTAIKQAGLEENTLIFFASDNGGPTAELTSSNYPLRGGKGQLYDGGIRVPFAMRWKGRVPEGKVVREPATALDILPTALDAAGVTAPRLDGLSLLKPLPKERPLYWRYGQNAALRLGQWKIVRQSPPGKAAEFQLFDLTQDPSEIADLSAAQPQRFDALRAEFRRLDAQMAPPLW